MIIINYKKITKTPIFYQPHLKILKRLYILNYDFLTPKCDNFNLNYSHYLLTGRVIFHIFVKR